MKACANPVIEEKKNRWIFILMDKKPFLPPVRPMRKRRVGKQNFTQVLPWPGQTSVHPGISILEIPTLFCPNGLNDGLQNFLTGQWT